MIPSRFHVPPRPSGASHTTRGRPPVMLIVQSLPPAKKPMASLAGAQKGNIAPSVSGTGRAVIESSDRSQSWPLPSAPDAVKAKWRSSGDTWTDPKLIFSGGNMENWSSTSIAAGVSERWTSCQTTMIVAATSTAAEIQRRRPRRVVERSVGVDATGSGPVLGHRLTSHFRRGESACCPTTHRSRACRHTPSRDAHADADGPAGPRAFPSVERSSRRASGKPRSLSMSPAGRSAPARMGGPRSLAGSPQPTSVSGKSSSRVASLAPFLDSTPHRSKKAITAWAFRPATGVALASIRVLRAHARCL